MTASTISAYEKCQKVPNLSSVFELSKALDVSIDWLCGTEDKNAVDHFNSLTQFEVLAQMIVFLGMSDFYDIAVDNDDIFDKSAIITFKQPAVVDFISGFKKLKELYESNVLTGELFNAGIDGLISKYKDVKIDQSYF